MKKLLFFFTASILILSCKKDDTPATSGVGPAPGDCSKLPYKKGSSLTMSLANGVGITSTYSKDTTINGQYYVGAPGTSTNGISAVSWVGLNSNREVLLYVNSIGDLPASNIIAHKLNAAVGATWSQTFASVSLPTDISYKYTYTVLSNSETFSFNGVNYTGGQKVRGDFQITFFGSPMSTTSTISTYCCGIGIVKTEESGNVRTLTAYKY